MNRLDRDSLSWKVFLWSQSHKLLSFFLEDVRILGKPKYPILLLREGPMRRDLSFFFYEFYLIRGQWPRWQMMACHHYLDPGSGLEDSFLESCVRVGGMPVFV